MKVSEELKTALRRRERAAEAWLRADAAVTRALKKYSPEILNHIDTSDYLNGVEGLMNAEDASQRIIEVIKQAEI